MTSFYIARKFPSRDDINIAINTILSYHCLLSGLNMYRSEDDPFMIMFHMTLANQWCYKDISYALGDMYNISYTPHMDGKNKCIGYIMDPITRTWSRM